jgi:hypothetical protein
MGMDYTPYDYAPDRVSNLEVTLLRDELRMVATVGKAGGQTEPVSSRQKPSPEERALSHLGKVVG